MKTLELDPQVFGLCGYSQPTHFQLLDVTCPMGSAVEDNRMGVKSFPGSIAPVRHVRKISRVAQSATLPGLPGNFRLRNLIDPRMSWFQERIGAPDEQLVPTFRFSVSMYTGMT